VMKDWKGTSFLAVPDIFCDHSGEGSVLVELGRKEEGGTKEQQGNAMDEEKLGGNALTRTWAPSFPDVKKEEVFLWAWVKNLSQFEQQEKGRRGNLSNPVEEKTAWTALLGKVAAITLLYGNGQREYRGSYKGKGALSPKACDAIGGIILGEDIPGARRKNGRPESGREGGWDRING